MLSPVRHTGISQKQLKSGLCNFEHTVAPSLFRVSWDKFHPEILIVTPEWVSNSGVRKLAIF